MKSARANLAQTFAVGVLLHLMLSTIANATEPVRIYVDADRSGTRESGLAIEQGIRTALHEVDNRLGGRPVEIIIRDHRGNTRRSKRHLDEFLDDPHGLAVFGGLHSPPLLANRDFINEQGILMLVPWAAAGPITRAASNDNWIFRLSVDDTKAGHVIVDYAVSHHKSKRPALLLEETGWGRSNKKTMTDALAKHGISPSRIVWFNWNLTMEGARIHLRSISEGGADSILLVANAPEGKTFARAMASMPVPQRIPVFSHWGITGGDFPDVIDAKIRNEVSIKFIQTTFSFVSQPDHELGSEVFNRATKLFPDAIQTPADIKAPTGFVHAYDLTRLLMAAVENVGLQGSMVENRARVRTALENLDSPIKGLIKTYVKPFGAYTVDRPDAHEALDQTDLIMARFGPDGEILLEK